MYRSVKYGAAMKIELKNTACFGVAGNFTGHLEQAGEAADFVSVAAAENAPKAVLHTRSESKTTKPTLTGKNAYAVTAATRCAPSRPSPSSRTGC